MVIRLSWKKCLLTLSVVIASSCTSTENEGWVPELYTGQPETGSIVRGQDRGVIKATSPEFKDYACMSHKDLERLFKACLEAKRPWFQIGE